MKSAVVAKKKSVTCELEYTENKATTRDIFCRIHLLLIGINIQTYSSYSHMCVCVYFIENLTIPQISGVLKRRW